MQHKFKDGIHVTASQATQSEKWPGIYHLRMRRNLQKTISKHVCKRTQSHGSE